MFNGSSIELIGCSACLNAILFLHTLSLKNEPNSMKPISFSVHQASIETGLFGGVSQAWYPSPLVNTEHFDFVDLGLIT